MGEETEWHGRIAGLINDKLQVEVSSIDTDLFETGVLDSLAFVELLTLLEQEFNVNVEFNDLEIENFSTIRNLGQFVLERTRRQRVTTAMPGSVKRWEDTGPTASPDTPSRESEWRQSLQAA